MLNLIYEISNKIMAKDVSLEERYNNLGKKL